MAPSRKGIGSIPATPADLRVSWGEEFDALEALPFAPTDAA